MWPAGTVPYSQNMIHGATGYRQDCSGFLSMCWGIPLNAPGSWGGLSTVTLLTSGYIRMISPADLRPGDAVGICGPDTGGDAGHIVLFEKWATDAPDESRYWLYEQAGGRSGPVHRMTSYPYGGPTGAWRAYRFRDITDTPGGNVTDLNVNQWIPAAARNINDVLGDLHAGIHTPIPELRAAVDRLAVDLKAARAEIAALRLGDLDVTELAAALAPLLGVAPSAEVIAKAVADELARRARE